jgi:phage tail tube protein FII
MSTLYTMEAANIFAGSDDPSATNHLAIQEVKLPGFEENFADHIAGGAVVGIRIDTHINPLEATFNLLGFNPQVAGLLRSWTMTEKHFHIRGVVRDRQSGRAISAYALIYGRLSRVNPTAFRRSDLFAHEYTINGIDHYELTLDAKQLFLFDFFSNTLVINGDNRNRETNAILNITDQASGVPGSTGGQIFPSTNAQ